MTQDNTSNLASKVQAMLVALNKIYLERDEALRACLVAFLAKQHVFILGPPGTAKSTMIEKFCKAIIGADYFEWLMDRFTQPEDLFGPTKISKLKMDEYERNIAGTLVTAHLAFLDEIWKAGGSILNALLRLMDLSRRFYNNRQVVQTPLMSLVGASNELPESAELNALWDRFLVRLYVGDVSDDRNFKTIFMYTSRGGAGIKVPTMTLDELTAAQAAAAQVVVSEAIGDLMVTLRTKLRHAGFEFSTRRWVSSVSLLQASAWLRGCGAVEIEDLEILANVFWNIPDDIKTVRKIVAELINPDMTRALEILDKAQEVFDNAVKSATTAAGAEANDKFKTLMRELENLKGPRVQEIKTKITDMQSEVLHVCLGMRF